MRLKLYILETVLEKPYGETLVLIIPIGDIPEFLTWFFHYNDRPIFDTEEVAKFIAP